MDPDFYIEEDSPLKVIIIIFIFVGLIGGGLYYYLNHKNDTTIKIKNVTLELGDKLSLDIKDYATSNNISEYTIDLSNVSVDDNGNANVTGEYSYRIKGNNETYKGKIYVKDTTSPDVTLRELTVGVGEEFSPNEYIKSCTDLSMPCTASYKNPKNENLKDKEGTYEVEIKVVDKEGNSTIKKTKLIVSSKTTLIKIKESNLKLNHLSSNESNWNNTYTLKLDSAVEENSLKFNELFDELSTKEYNLDKDLDKKEIILAYNEYDYVIGFIIKITYKDNTVKYLTSADEIKSESEE